MSKNHVASLDPVYVLLTHREDGDQDVVEVYGVFARQEFAEEQARKALADRPELSLNVVGVFLDAAARSYPGLRINHPDVSAASGETPERTADDG